VCACVCVLVCVPMRVCVRACPCAGKNKEKKEGTVLIKRRGGYIFKFSNNEILGRCLWSAQTTQVKKNVCSYCVTFPCLNCGMQIHLRSFLQSRVHAAAKASQEWLEVAIDSSLKKHSMYTLVYVEKCMHFYKNKHTCIVDKGPAHPKRMSAHRYLKSCKWFEQIELPAKLLDYFFWSNKSNINQYTLQQMLL